MTESDAPTFHARLAAVIDRVREPLLEQRVVNACGPALESAAPLLLAVPLCYGCASLLRFLNGSPAGAAHAPWVIALTMLVPLVWLVLQLVWVRMQPIDPRAALAEIDLATGAEERLLTAYEFGARSALTAFEQAAIDDALPHLDRALTTPIAVPRGQVHVARRTLRPMIAAAIALPLCLWLARLEHAATPGVASPGAVAPTASHDVARAPGDPPAPPRTAPPERTATERGHAEADARSTAATARSFATGLAQRVKESEGKTGAGQSSNAESISGQSDSQGVPTNQAQATRSAADNKLAAHTAKKQKPTPPAVTAPRKELEESSGATAGRGASGGSNKNPASTDWASKDQVTSSDDEKLESDEGIEDESEDSSARGGVQPSLRDRRPPVSRDLQIGFGNGKSPDANGRGGPSARKKSRGTASLVLGVPIPDRIKGQPNPGKTKITQERVQPRAEDAEAQSAQARTPRDARIGKLAQPDLPPWMQQLVRTYFLTLRSRERGAP